jgi:GNAT superfamily N-acetyltransferase
MCDEWMPAVKLPITREQLHQLPRHPAYQYEYRDDHAHLRPMAKFYHAMLALDHFRPTEPAPRQLTIRLLHESDIAGLEPVFSAAFDQQQPFASLDDARRLEAAGQSLDKVRAGHDGPWLQPASFVAAHQQQPVGAIFITLLPDEDPSDWDSFRWREPPPPDCVERRLGRPHITWIFVDPCHAGLGAGTALLGAAVASLRSLGYQHLASTFLLGNASSMLWHWRNGFELQAHPGSRRAIKHGRRNAVIG